MSSPPIHHGSHVHALIMQPSHWFTSRFCGVCKGSLVSGGAVAVCSPCAFVLCHKCYNIPEIPLHTPMFCLINHVSDLHFVRTRPNPTSHVLCTMYPNTIYTVVSTVDGGRFGRLDHGGWIELDPLVISSLTSSEVNLFVANLIGNPDTEVQVSLEDVLQVLDEKNCSLITKDFATVLLEALIESPCPNTYHLSLTMKYLIDCLSISSPSSVIPPNVYHADEQLRIRYGYHQNNSLLGQSVMLGFWLRTLCVLGNLIQPEDRMYLLEEIDRKAFTRSLLNLIHTVSSWMLSSSLHVTSEFEQPNIFVLRSVVHQNSSQREQTMMNFALSIIHSSVWILHRVSGSVDVADLFTSLGPWWNLMQRSGFPTTHIGAAVLDCYVACLQHVHPRELPHCCKRMLESDLVEFVIKMVLVSPKPACDLLSFFVQPGTIELIKPLTMIIIPELGKAVNQLLMQANGIQAVTPVLNLLTKFCRNHNFFPGVRSEGCSVVNCGRSYVLQPMGNIGDRMYCLHCCTHCRVPVKLEDIRPALGICHCNCSGRTAPSSHPDEQLYYSCSTPFQDMIVRSVSLPHCFRFCADPQMAKFLLALCSLNRKASNDLIFARVQYALFEYLSEVRDFGGLEMVVDLYVYLNFWDGEGYERSGSPLHDRLGARVKTAAEFALCSPIPTVAGTPSTEPQQTTNRSNSLEKIPLLELSPTVNKYDDLDNRET